MRIAFALALIACGKASESPAAGSGSSAEPTRLRVVSRLPASSTLVTDSRRIAIDADGRWLESTPDGLQPVPATAAAIAGLRGELGELTVHLGRTVIAIGGEEHHEQVWRVGGGQVVGLEAHVTKVVATDAYEVWSYEERLRARLAVVDTTVTPLPALPLVGSPIEGASPVSTKLCAAPAIRDLAATRASVVALVVECDPDAAVRLVTYRWPGPAVTTEALASTRTLGFVPVRLAVSEHQRVVAGATPDGGLRVLVVGRPVRMVAGHALAGLAVSEAGEIWSIVDGVVRREDQPVVVTDPAGTRLVPRSIARDPRLGIAVLATARDAAWLLAARP